MDIEKIIKIVSRILSFCLMFILITLFYLESKGHIYSNGFDIIGRLGLRSDNAIKEKSENSKIKYKKVDSLLRYKWSEEITEITKEKIFGNSDSNIIIYEYSSFDCPACSKFHNKILPQIKQQYIETNKASLIFKDFPLKRRGMVASALSKCISEGKYYNFVDKLMENQHKFLFSKNALLILKNYAIEFGINEQLINKCLNNEELFLRLNYLKKEAADKYEINSTPTIIIENKKGDSIKIVGAKDFEVFKEIIEKLNK